MLADWQDEGLKRLQTHALKCIYGPGISGKRMRELAGLDTLRERRITRCDRFAANCANGDRFCDWFPRNVARRATRRGAEQYKEEYAR